jgi:archaetidylinositol phosphate synthase
VVLIADKRGLGMDTTSEKPKGQETKTQDDAVRHTRVNKILLGFLERPALRWLCERMPLWMTPDILTAIGLVGAFGVGAGYMLARYNPLFIWLASLGLVVNWFGDSLDGSLARHRHIERPKYGFFIDHTIDVIAEVAIFGGVALSGYVTPVLALLALVGYLMMSVFVYVYTFVSREFRISFGGMGPTEMRMVVIISNALIFFIGKPVLNLGFIRFGLYDGILVMIIAVLYLGYIWMVAAKAIELARLERQ